MRLSLAAIIFAVLPSPAVAQVGLLVVAHGADSAWNARVEQTVAAVQWNRGEVRTAFLMGSAASNRSWNAGVESLVAAGARSIVIVPLMVSTYGEHVWQIRSYAGEAVDLPASLAAMGHPRDAVRPPSIAMHVTRAIDAAPELGEILGDRWGALPTAMRSGALVLVAHGPSADSLVGGWLVAINSAAAPLIAKLGAANVRVGLLRDDAEPAVRATAIASLRDTITALSIRQGDSVTVMTVLISSGGINRVTVPNDLRGLPVRYVGASLAPHPALARWIERVATAAANP